MITKSFCQQMPNLAYILLGDIMSKETFKMFVRSHPELVNYVNNNKMSWQRFYEMYDMYGENNSVWNSYFTTTTDTINTNVAATASNTISKKTVGDTPIKEIFNMVKQMDLETVRKGVDGLQKAVGLVQDLTVNKKMATNYQARPLYQHLDD